MCRLCSSKVGSRFRDPFLDSTDGKEPGLLEIPKTTNRVVRARGIISNRVGNSETQLFRTINDAQRALLRSQSGPGASSCAPRLARLDSFTFRTLFCRRLRLPLPLTKHICRCGRRTDFYGHHRATCAQSGGFRSSGFCSGKRGCQSVL